MKKLLANIILIGAGLGLFACSTNSTNKTQANYQIRAKLWVDGELKSEPMVNTLEHMPAEIAQEGGKDNYRLQFNLNENKKDRYTLDVAYSLAQGSTAQGGSFKVKARFDESTETTKDRVKLEFRVIKL